MLAACSGAKRFPYWDANKQTGGGQTTEPRTNMYDNIRSILSDQLVKDAGKEAPLQQSSFPVICF